MMPAVNSWRRLGVAALMLCLAACATRPPALERFDWQLTGKLSLAFQARRESASFVWRQSADRFEVLLLDPFGRALAEARGSAGRLDVAVDERHRVDPAFLHAIEEDMPVSLLSHWLQGKPGPGEAQVTARPGETLPDQIRQAGWLIEYLDYREQRVHKLRLSSPDLNLMIVVSKWQGEGGE